MIRGVKSRDMSREYQFAFTLTKCAEELTECKLLKAVPVAIISISEDVHRVPKHCSL
jgi:hypothetical protein